MVAVEDDRFAQLRATWERLAPRRAPVDASEWHLRLKQMQIAQRDIAADGGWSAGPSTLMSVLQISRREVLNCRVVKWLLDPLARHGIGAPMIAAFANATGLTLPEPQHARSETEVVRTRSRADVVVTGAGDAWTVVIEAKIGAGEGPEQGWRLEQDWLYSDEPLLTTHLVFLTTGGERRPSTARQPKRWVPIRWNWFADEAVRQLKETDRLPDLRSAEARHAVMEWAAAARRSLQ